MPRFLGRDYYNDDFIARRDLSARASLTVPRRFEEDCENDQSVSSEIYRVYQKSLGDLSPFEDFDDISKSGLDVSDKIVSGVEQLQWVLKWKEFGDGNYIEIVPSSNPESESSLFDSQPDSLTEACEVEDFSQIPLQWTLEDKGYLEEPVHEAQSELLTTCLPNLMKWLTQALGPPLEDLSSAAEEDGQQVSEDALFGKTDLHLEVSADLGSEVPPEPSSSKTFREQETFEPHIFPPAKAEELMYPVLQDDAACSSRQHNHDPQTLVHEARTTCIQQENLQASPLLLPTEHLENEEMAKPKPDTSVLESPVILLTSSSPSLYDDNMKEALLEPWPQDTLADNRPLLNAEEVSKLEEKLRYAETCFGNIQAVKFLEPQLYNHEEEAKKKNLGLLSEALHLAASVNCTAGLAQLELNLAWDLTHPARHQLSQFCPEPFSLGPASHAQTNTWKTSLEFETVETMVERELEKKAIQDTQKETAEDKAINQLGPSQEAAVGETTALTGFDLRFDEEDLDLGSDYFDDITSPNKTSKSEATSSAALCPGVAFDPVDNFLMMRDARTSGSKTQDLVKGHSVVRPVERTQQAVGKPHHPGVITPMTVLPKKAGAKQQIFLTVSLSGPYLSALQEMCSQAEPHMDSLRTLGIVSANATFLGLRPDYTRFLLKDRMTRLENAADTGDASSPQVQCTTDEGYRSVAMVHTLRLAAHMLVHCCLESAIVHLGAMQDKHTVLTGALEGLRKALFQCQFGAQQSGQLHPKVAAVCREIQQHRQSSPSPHKVLVVVRHEHPTLVKTLQAAISQDGTTAHILTGQDGQHSWPSGCECVLTWDQGAAVALLQVCSLVLEFESDSKSPMHNACQTENVHYVGLSVQETQTIMTETKMPSADKGVTVIGSQHLIQFQQLLQLLETRHNILVVRRDYASLGHEHYPDVVANVHKGAVLVPAGQLREEGGLERVTERLASVGLQLSTVWVLLHGMGDSCSRDLFDKDAVKKMVQLQALMANLSTSAKGFLAHYKEENFLLGIPCLNPFSCQLLLSRTCVGQILTMTLDQLRSLLPELPESCLLNLHRVVNMDRGLQLRPYVTDTHSSSQTYDHNNSPSRHHPLPDSTSLLDGQHEEKVDRAVPDDSQTLLPVIDRSQRQTGPPSSRYQDSERSDYVSPQTTLPSVPLSLSRSLHYTDQPTPLLPPAQKVSEESDGFHAKNMYRMSSVKPAHISAGRSHQSRIPYQRRMLDVHSLEQPVGRLADPLHSSSLLTLDHQFLSPPLKYLKMNTVHDPDHSSIDFASNRPFEGRRSHADDHSSIDFASNRPFEGRRSHADDHSSIDFASNRPFEGRRSHADDHSSIDFASNRPFEGRRSHADDHSNIDFASNRPFEDSRSHAEDYSSIDFASNRPFEGRRSHAEDHSSIDFASNRPFEGRRSHAEDHSSIDFASNRPFEGRHAEGITPAVSGSGPVDYYRTNSTWNDHNLWPSVHSAQGRFMNDREVYQKKAEPNQNQAFLQRNETLPLENPVSPSWQTGFTKTWEPHNYSLDPGYRKTSSQIFPSAEESDTMIHPVESLRPQTTLAKELVCVRNMDPSESRNMARTYPAHFRQLTRSDFPSPSGGEGYHSPGRESSATRYGDEDTRHPPPDVTASRSQPSFCEDLAATTRRLLQGRSPGLLLSGGHHFHKPRTPVHRISVGLAQPLRREEARAFSEGGELYPRTGARMKGQKLIYQSVPGTGGQTRLAFL
ncbi:hypothetical protein ACOMHN_034164 [Nucella lapillus]